MQTFTQRLIGALKLDKATYEEVEHDPAATRQAAIIVAVAAIVSGVVGAVLSPDNMVTALVGQLASALVGWAVWAFVMWLIGTKIFDADATVPEMLRVLGFAYAPSILSAVPCVNFFVFFWLLATGFVAVRAGLDLDNGKTIVTIVLGIAAMIAVMLAIMIPLGIAGALVGGITQGL